MEEKKLIFLDVNGVLDSIDYSYEMNEKNRTSFDTHYFNPTCFENLKVLIDATDAYIVVSSEWKRRKDLMERLINELSKYELGDRVIGVTPIKVVRNGNCSKVDRGLEIRTYLEEHPCDNYVVIDDTNWDLEGFKERFIWTYPSVGLSEDDVNQAISILNKKDKQLKL